MTIDDKVKLLINYIDNLDSFNIIETGIPYYHMGATIADAMLQAGVKYETVVWPRVDKLRQKYPEAKTTTGFLRLLEKTGVREVLKWNDPEKPNRVEGVTRFFVEQGIETEADLKTWLENESNVERLKELRGIGNKTADYFKKMAGIPTSAIDRHLIKLLNQAGIDVDIDIGKGYVEAREIVNKAAEAMRIDKSVFDHSIWKYMSGERGIRSCKMSSGQMARQVDTPAAVGKDAVVGDRRR